MEVLFITFTVLKYLFSIILTIVASIRVDQPLYFLAGILELFFIFILSNLLAGKKIIGRVLNAILLLFYNAQMAVLFFANSFITMVMLTNIVSIKALSGKAVVYIAGVCIVLLFSFLPIKKFCFEKKEYICMGMMILLLQGGFFWFFGINYSSIGGYCTIIEQYYKSVQLTKMLEDLSDMNSSDDKIIEYMKDSEFYHDDIKDHRTKDAGLSENPNVILIFTEGLSQSVVNDEREIMPNVKEWQEQSLQFTNYYNHTFATYRGLQSQLYSGYQKEDFDQNPLISLQSILQNEGYVTLFLNSEPNNEEFTTYLQNFEFDGVLGDTDSVCNGMADSISDKDVYEMLFETATDLEETGLPFFLSTYTFGTHASLDSPDEIYGDGKDAELNKFYNVDYYFGQFMEKFVNSSLAENTIIIFTADHATYQDDSFSSAFPDYKREVTSLDEIPFFIYYKGIESECIDVGGRNSICMTPTILDYLDISAPNYFVGTSLFSEEAGSICETSYTDSYTMYSSREGVLTELEKTDQASFEEIVQNYYILKVKAQ